jgi:2-polyprenyl-3-methyl-5-hydroxy-6-metoxy-1,4-benzoquinol methylase
METDCHAPRCPLCGGEDIDPFYKNDNRTFLSCLNCQLVFVPKHHWLSTEDEKATYDLHENDPQDLRYRRFLSRFVTPLVEKLTPGQKGLDFGCGPGPTLSILLAEQGQQVDLFDPFYHNDPSVFDKEYDFICATEVVEHLRDPKRVFSALFKMLKPGGWLGMMTKQVKDRHAFRQWHYIRDLTHICFYRQRTFEYLAQRFGADLDIVADDVILLNRK